MGKCYYRSDLIDSVPLWDSHIFGDFRKRYRWKFVDFGLELIFF